MHNRFPRKTLRR